MISQLHIRGFTDVGDSLKYVKDLSELVTATEAKTEELKAHKKDCIELASKIQILISAEEIFHVLKPSRTLSNSGVQRAFAIFRDALRRSAKLLENCGRAMKTSTFYPRDATAVQEVEQAILESISLLRLALKAQSTGETAELLEEQLSGSTSVPQNDTSAPQFILLEPPSGVLGGSIEDVLAKLSEIPVGIPTSDDKSVHIPAKSFSIAFGDDERYWRTTTRPGSKSDEVLYLNAVCHFDVRATINTKALRAGTFTLVWRYQLLCLDDFWETSSVTFKMSKLEGPDLVERSMFLCPKAAYRYVHQEFMFTPCKTEEGQTPSQTSSQTPYQILCSKDASPNAPPIWVEYPIFNFTVEEGQSSPLVFSMSETGSRWKRGLFLDALVISRISEKCYNLLPTSISNADFETDDDANSMGIESIDDAYKRLSAS